MRKFIPDFILKNYSAKIFHGNFNALVMFCDITGFTNMTEELMKNGKEGLEVLTDLINSVFSPAIEIVQSEGGFISSFAGDAFTAIFPMDKPLESDISRSLGIADKIRNSNSDITAKETKFGTFGLSMKIGVSYGNCEWGIIKESSYLNYYFRGEVVKNSAVNQKYAHRNEILFDSKIMNLLGLERKYFELNKNNEGIYSMISAEINVDSAEKKIITDSPSNELNDFEGCVYESLLKLDIEGEFREVGCCVISFTDDPGWEEMVSVIIKKVDIYGGYFNKIDFGDKGGLAFVLFGAPCASENIISRVCNFAMDIRSMEGYENINIIGISFGLCYTGFIGSRSRREYTAIGSVINRAVRYLNRANKGDILIDKVIYDRKKEDFIVEIFQNEKFKGFESETTIFRIIRKKDKIVSGSNFSAFVGRETEKKLLFNSIKPVFEGVFGGFVYVDGSAGIGKSRLISEIKRIVLNNKIMKLPLGTSSWFYLPCDPILKKSFNPFSYFFRSYFEQSDNNSKEINHALFEAKYFELVNETEDENLKIELERTKPFLGFFVNLFGEDSFNIEIDPKSRYENMIYAVKNFFKAKSLIEPVVIEIADGIWIDPDSIKLLNALNINMENYPIVMISDTRYSDDGSEFRIIEESENSPKRIKLEKLEHELSKEMVENILKTRYGKTVDIPKKTIEFIIEKTEDNPFYIEQILQYFIKNSLFENDLTIKNEGFEIPSSISAIIIARVDRLRTEIKKVVQTASVLGRKFNIKVLSRMLNNRSIEDDLKEGENENLWIQLAELNYIFTHALISESIYQMQLKKQLRELHKLAAETFEELFSVEIEHYYFDIANHYDKSDNKEKAVEYLYKAACQSQKEYMNEQSIILFERVIGILNETKNKGLMLINCYIAVGESYQTIGKWANSRKSYESAVNLSNECSDKSKLAEALVSLGWLDFMKGKYDIAMGNLNKGLKIFKKLGNQTNTAFTLREIGLTYQMKGNNSKAEEYFSKSLLLAEKTKNKRAISSALGNLGSLYSQMKNYRKALEFLNEQLKMAEEIKDIKIISSAVGNIGVLYDNLGKYEIAQNYFERVAIIAEETGDKYLRSTAICNLGVILENNGEFDKAMDNYLESLEISKETGEKYGIAFMLGNIGFLNMINENYDEALRNLSEAINISDNIGTKWFSVKLYSYMCDLLINLDDLENAEKFNKKLSESAELIGDKDHLLRSTFNENRIKIKNDDLTKEQRTSVIRSLEEISQSLTDEDSIATMMYLTTKDSLQNVGTDHTKMLLNKSIRILKTLYSKKKTALYKKMYSELEEISDKFDS